MQEDLREIVFRSNNHPASRTRGHVFSLRMVQPLAACTLPVMIIGLSVLLSGYPSLPFLYIGFPAAIFVAAIWTSIRISDEIVEVHFRGSAVAIQSLLDAARPEKPLRWFRLLDVRRADDVVVITLGHEIYTLKLSDWSDGNDLIDELTSRTALGTDRSSDSVQKL